MRLDLGYQGLCLISKYHVNSYTRFLSTLPKIKEAFPVME